VKFDLFLRYGAIAAAGDRHFAEFCPGKWYLADPDSVRKWGFGLTPVSWRKERLAQRLENGRQLRSGQMPVELVTTGEEGVRQMRESSSDAGTRRLADYPHLFRETLNPESCIIVPSASSERRRYIPMGFITSSTIVTNLVLIIPDGSLYHFGVLTSNVHMAWMRAVCGRLKSDYRYSKDIVYNNFPWPEVSEAQKAKIEQTAQAILDARALYPDSSLADLYDEVTMPPELRRAHQQNDRAVMEAYGFPTSRDFTESDCVARLFEKYKRLTQ
jgi:hypothetical protein